MRNFVSVLLMLVCVSSEAFVVDLDPNNTTHAIGIRNLDIQGTAYDVVFEFRNGPHNTRQLGDIFIDEAGAVAAVNAINTALNSLNMIGGVGITADNRYLLPWEFDTNRCGSQGDSGTCAQEGREFGNSWNGLFHELDSTNDDVPVEFATFSAAVVPVPAAAWLFGSARGMLVFIRKRTLHTAA